MDENKYLEYFNRFYAFQKEYPDLAKEVLSGISGDNDIVEAIQSGAERARKEKYEENILQTLREKLDRGLERGSDFSR